MSSHRVASTNRTVGGGAFVGRPIHGASIPIRKVVKENFRGPAPRNQPLVQLYMALPSNKMPTYIDPQDAFVKKTLDKIKERCEVWIDVADGGNMLLISGRTKDKVVTGFDEIRQWQCAQAKDVEETSTVLVHRTAAVESYIVLDNSSKLGGAQAGPADGFWRGVALPGGAMENRIRAFDDVSGAVEYPLARGLFEAFKQMAQSVRPDLGQKYVRVHLGLRTMSKKKKDLDANVPEARTKYGASQFHSLLDSAIKRGHSSFQLCFGDEALTQTILQHIYETDDSSDPESQIYFAPEATMDRLDDVKPKFCLVFFSAGFRIEMDIHFETSNPVRKYIASKTRSIPIIMNVPTASDPRVFRYNKTVDAEVAVACPDMQVDWQISVESDLGADKIHDKFRELARNLRFDLVSEETLTFPDVRVSRDALVKANIDDVACKVYRTFQCNRAPYLAEIATYYDWHANPLSVGLANSNELEFHINTSGHKCPSPNKSCAISLYGDDWDADMRQMNPASANFSHELVKLFYNPDSDIATNGSQLAGEVSAGHLIREVESLLDITTQAAAELESR